MKPRRRSLSLRDNGISRMKISVTRPASTVGITVVTTRWNRSLFSGEGFSTRKTLRLASSMASGGSSGSMVKEWVLVLP